MGNFDDNKNILGKMFHLTVLQATPEQHLLHPPLGLANSKILGEQLPAKNLLNFKNQRTTHPIEIVYTNSCLQSLAEI